MSGLIAATVYWARILRQPIDARLKRRHVGGFLIFAVAFVLLALWAGQQTGALDGFFWGEFLGVTAVYLFSWSLVLATRLRALEPVFGGLDRMYRWHRSTAVVGFFMLVPHVVLTMTPRGQSASRLGDALGVLSLFGLSALVVVSLSQVAKLIRLRYEPWLLIHRTTGLLVMAAVVHGALVDPMLRSSLLLQVTYLSIGGLGVLAYLYKELAARLTDQPSAYTVQRVERPTADRLDVTLAAAGTPLKVRSGQFLFFNFQETSQGTHQGAQAAQWHPFSVAGVGDDGSLRLSIKALGDYTQMLYERLGVGEKAGVSGPYGMFDITLGGTRQLWIAGGSGVAPFMGWLRQPGALGGRRIDFYYSVRTPAEALYLDEIQAVAAREPGLRVHLIVTSIQGHLTAQQLQRQSGGPLGKAHVFLCGPAQMVESLTRDLRALRVPADQIHSEQFAFR